MDNYSLSYGIPTGGGVYISNESMIIHVEHMYKCIVQGYLYMYATGGTCENDANGLF